MGSRSRKGCRLGRKNNSEKTEGSEMGRDGGRTPKEPWKLPSLTFFHLPFGGVGTGSDWTGTVWDDGRGDGFDAQTDLGCQGAETGGGGSQPHGALAPGMAWARIQKGGMNPLFGVGPNFCGCGAQTPMQRLTDQQEASCEQSTPSTQETGMRRTCTCYPHQQKGRTEECSAGQLGGDKPTDSHMRGSTIILS
jgi:hypothetical protein